MNVGKRLCGCEMRISEKKIRSRVRTEVTWLHALTSPRSLFCTQAASERLFYSLLYSDVTVLLLYSSCASLHCETHLLNNLIYDNSTKSGCVSCL